MSFASFFQSFKLSPQSIDCSFFKVTLGKNKTYHLSVYHLLSDLDVTFYEHTTNDGSQKLQVTLCSFELRQNHLKPHTLFTHVAINIAPLMYSSSFLPFRSSCPTCTAQWRATTTRTRSRPSRLWKTSKKKDAFYVIMFSKCWIWIDLGSNITVFEYCSQQKKCTGPPYYYFPWVAWNWLINLRIVCPQKAGERNFFTQFHATRGK